MGVVILRGWLRGSKGRPEGGATPPMSMLEERRSSDRMGEKRVLRGREAKQRLPPSPLFFLLAGFFATTLFVSLNLVPAAGMERNDTWEVVNADDHGTDEEMKDKFVDESDVLLMRKLSYWRSHGIQKAIAEAKTWTMKETKALFDLMETLIKTASVTPRYLRHRASGYQFVPDDYVKSALDKLLKSFDKGNGRKLVRNCIFVNVYCPRLQNDVEPMTFLSLLKLQAANSESSRDVFSSIHEVEEELKEVLARTTKCGEKGAEEAIHRLKSSTFRIPDFAMEGIERQGWSADEAAALGIPRNRKDIMAKIESLYLPVLSYHLRSLGTWEGQHLKDAIYEENKSLESGIYGPKLFEGIKKVMDATQELSPDMTSEALKYKISELKREIWYPPVMDFLDDPKAGFKNWIESFEAERAKLLHDRIYGGKRVGCTCCYLMGSCPVCEEAENRKRGIRPAEAPRRGRTGIYNKWTVLSVETRPATNFAVPKNRPMSLFGRSSVSNTPFSFHQNKNTSNSQPVGFCFSNKASSSDPKAKDKKPEDDEPIEVDDDLKTSESEIKGGNQAIKPGNEPSQDKSLAGIGLPLAFSLGAVLIAITFLFGMQQTKAQHRGNLRTEN